MPRIAAKKTYASTCGNDKCGTFATDHHMHPHAGGTHVLPGLHNAKNGPTPHPIIAHKQSHPHAPSIKQNMHGGAPVPHHSAYKAHREPDADDRGGRSDHDADNY